MHDVCQGRRVLAGHPQGRRGRVFIKGRGRQDLRDSADLLGIQSIRGLDKDAHHVAYGHPAAKRHQDCGAHLDLVYQRRRYTVIKR